MALKSDAKFEEELTCAFKNDMRNLQNFDSSTQKPKKKLLLNWFLWPNYMLELKKNRGVMFAGIEDWCTIWRKTDLCFQKGNAEFGKFA